MNKLRNIVTLAIVTISLTASHSLLLAHEDAHDGTHSHENDHHHYTAHTADSHADHHHPHHGTTNPNNVSMVIQNLGTKRDVAITRMIWAVIKNSIGGTLLIAGAPTAIASPFAICAGIAAGSPSMTAGASIVFITSFPIAYFGYKLVQSSFNTIRDEFIESAGLK